MYLISAFLLLLISSLFASLPASFCFILFYYVIVMYKHYLCDDARVVNFCLFLLLHFYFLLCFVRIRTEGKKKKRRNMTKNNSSSIQKPAGQYVWLFSFIAHTSIEHAKCSIFICHRCERKIKLCSDSTLFKCVCVLSLEIFVEKWHILKLS